MLSLTLTTTIVRALITKFREELPWFSWFLFCGQFLKARIGADLIPHRIESQKRRSNRKATRHLQQPFENGNRTIGIPQESVDSRHVLLLAGAFEWISGSGIHGQGFLSFGNSSGRFAQTCMGLTQSAMQLRLGKRTRHDLLEFAL